jgi:hypothetical protein
MEWNPFSYSSLQSIVIPSSVEILGSLCFLRCKLLSSISFESNSRLMRVESEVFSPSAIRALIPPAVLFVAHDADPDLFELFFSHPNFSLMLNGQGRLRKSGITVDFQRILRFLSSPFHFKDYLLDLSAYEEGEVIRQNPRVFSQIYRRRSDGAGMVVKAISISSPADLCKLGTEIENLLNLRHTMIRPLIGCVLSMDSTEQREFKTVRLYAAEGSLADVLSNPPAWWTPTAKAKASVGIVLGLRFAHGLGLLHGAVKASNMLFDADRWIQIADFGPIRLETGEVEPFSGEGWAPTADLSAFASLLFEIARGGWSAFHSTHRCSERRSSVCFPAD